MTHNIAPTLTDRAMPIALLEPHPSNARRRNDRARAELVASLRTNGQYRAVVARRLPRRKRVQLLAGHGTVEAARELGWDQVAVEVLEGVDDEGAARIVLVDNRTSDLAEYDDERLVELLSSLREFEGSGYSVDEFQRLEAMALSAAGGIGGLTDPDDAPVRPRVPVSRPGDLWLLGSHRLVCGDATRGDVWDLLLGGGRGSVVRVD